MMTLGVKRLAMVGLIFAACSGVGHASIVVEYRHLGDSTSSGPITLGGITATAANGGTLALNNFDGLGVVGGVVSDEEYIDGSESVFFHFDDGPAAGVSFLEGGHRAGPGFGLEAFDASGASLGTVTFNPVVIELDISAQFGGVALSGFRLYGNDSYGVLTVRSITYTTAEVAAVPEPASLAMLASGLPIALMAWRRRAGGRSSRNSCR